MRWLKASLVIAVIFYGQAVDSKVLAALNDIGTQHATDTAITNEAFNHLIDYLDTYPNYGIVYRASSMLLATH